jgi:hypothetical protein
MLLAIKLALIPASWLLVQLILKLTGAAKDAVWVGLLTAVLAAGSVELTSHIAAYLADPQLTVMVKHPQAGELDLTVSKQNRHVNRLDVTYQVLGRVKNIRNDDHNAAIGRITKQVVGYQDRYSVNQLRVIAENISSQTLQFSFKVFYEPVPQQEMLDKFGVDPMTLSDVDRFQYRYLWTHNGNTFERQTWQLVRSNERTLPPPSETLGFTVFPRALSEKEVQTYNERPIPLRQFP